MPRSTANGKIAGSVANPEAPSRERSPEDLRLALRAAILYYLDGLTQAEIAARLGVSRPPAGRLVARAKLNGLVRIEVVVPPDMRDDLHAYEERELAALRSHRGGRRRARYRRRGAWGTRGFASVGRAAAALLMRRLSATDTMGFTWVPVLRAVKAAHGRLIGPAEAAARLRVACRGDPALSAHRDRGSLFPFTVIRACFPQGWPTLARLRYIFGSVALYVDPGTIWTRNRGCFPWQSGIKTQLVSVDRVTFAMSTSARVGVVPLAACDLCPAAGRQEIWPIAAEHQQHPAYDNPQTTVTDPIRDAV
jgi:hypothetical protein